MLRRVVLECPWAAMDRYRHIALQNPPIFASISRYRSRSSRLLIMTRVLRNKSPSTAIQISTVLEEAVRPFKHTHEAKQRCEDDIQQIVRKRTEGTNAGSNSSSCKNVWARRVVNEGRRIGVKVPATRELLSVSSCSSVLSANSDMPVSAADSAPRCSSAPRRIPTWSWSVGWRPR